MIPRRRFLGTLAAGLGAATLRPARATAALPPEVKSPLGGPIGLQLWSLRNYLPKDVPGTLARLRALGIREVEGAGLAGLSAEAFRRALDAADLVCHSVHMDFDRIRKDAAGALKEARTLGATHLVCPWVPHDGVLTREVALTAVGVFNATGKAARDEGLRFSYHAHGYEFVPSSEGTLFDTIAKLTDPALVSFEIDLFWAKAGGVDPATLVGSLPGRVPLLHVKDMKKGLALPPASSGAPQDSDVAAGTGQLDFPAIFRAARKSGTEIFYIEDESTKPWEQIPESLKYLSGLSL